VVVLSALRFQPQSLKTDIRLAAKMRGVVQYPELFPLVDGEPCLRIAAPDGIDIIG
jgi:hypothetical protein